MMIIKVTESHQNLSSQDQQQSSNERQLLISIKSMFPLSFRIIRSTILSVPQYRNLRTSTVTLSRSHWFSTVRNHPTIDKILKNEDEKDLNQIFSEIGGLNEKNRQIALKLLLKRLFMSKLPMSILDNDRFLLQLRKNPEVYLQSLLFRIKQTMKLLHESLEKNDKQGTNKCLNTINNDFVSCFDSLKKIPEEKALKPEIMLHKRFADYHLLDLSKLVEPAHRKDILRKSRDFYKSTLSKMTILISLEQQKINKIFEDPLEPDQDEEKKEMKLNSMRENVRMLIETNSQNLLHLFIVEKELSNKSIEGEKAMKKQVEYNEDLVALYPEFDRGVGFYHIFKKMTTFSIFYHRLKRMTLELNYYSKMAGFKKFNKNPQEIKEFQTQKWKQLNTEMQKLYVETTEDMVAIQKEPNHIGGIQQMALLLLNIRISKLRQQNLDADSYKEKIFLEVGHIVGKIEGEEDKKVIYARLGKVIKKLLSSSKTS